MSPPVFSAKTTTARPLTLTQDNGGQIVVLEKSADVLIADHARKDTPVGSVSWTYITESVKNGGHVNIDDHKIHAANGSAKFTRARFTKEDDEILLAWVRRHKRAGERIGGNEIYKTLAKKVGSSGHIRTITEITDT